MRAKINESKNNLFKRFMISYIVVLFIPMIIAGIVFRETSDMMKVDALEANQKLLEQTQYIIDQGINEMNTLSNHIAMDPSFKWLANKKEVIEMSEIIKLRENLQRLQLYNLSTNFIMNYYLFFQNCDVVLTPRSTYKISDFYGYLYKRDDLTYNEWTSEVINKFHNKEIMPAATTFVDGDKTSVITYISSISAEYTVHPLGTIMILINKDELLKPMEGINTQGGGNVFIIDGSGNIIASKNNGNKEDIPFDILKVRSSGYSERIVNGKKMLVSYTTSELNGWTYIAVSTEKIVLSRVNYIKRLITISVILCSVVGILVAYFMASKNAKPIKEIIKMITSSMGALTNDDSDEYNYIQSTFSKLIDNDTALREKLQKHIPMAQAEFIRRLIKGEFNSIEEIQSNMMQVELLIKGQHFNVILVQIKGYSESMSIETLKELNALRLILKNSFIETSTCGIRAYPMDLDESMVAFVLDYDYEKNEECEITLYSFIKEIKHKLNNAYGTVINIAAGDFYDNLLDIYYSFSKAKYVFENGKVGNKEDIYWYSDVNEENSFYYYPIDLELRLINLMKVGNKEEVEKLLEIVYKENFENNKVSFENSNSLVSELRGTIQKTMELILDIDSIDYNNLRASIKKLKHYDSFDEAYKNIMEISIYMCNISINKKKGHSSKLKEDIISFLNENYMNQQLSLSFVASKFDFSDTNLSHFFKENVNENFSDYIEKLRIEKACEFILKSDFSVEDIAEKIGYSSSNSFRRAFKRSIGMTPSDYKRTKKDS